MELAQALREEGLSEEDIEAVEEAIETDKILVAIPPEMRKTCFICLRTIASAKRNMSRKES